MSPEKKMKPGFRVRRDRWDTFKKLAENEHLRSGNHALELLMEHAIEIGVINRPKTKQFAPQLWAGTDMKFNESSVHAVSQMASLKTICKLYDWKYDTLYKKYKNGEFVMGYRDAAGRGVRFDLDAVDKWAHQDPIKIIKPSLIAGEL